MGQAAPPGDTPSATESAPRCGGGASETLKGLNAAGPVGFQLRLLLSLGESKRGQAAAPLCISLQIPQLGDGSFAGTRQHG